MDDQLLALSFRRRASMRWKDRSRHGILSIWCGCGATTIAWIDGASEIAPMDLLPLELGCVRRAGNEGVIPNQVLVRVGNFASGMAIAKTIIAENGKICQPQAIIVATWFKVEASY
jgi:hypothetical protein